MDATEWRGRAPVVDVTRTESLLTVVGTIVVIAAGIALGVALGVGMLAPRLGGVIPLAALFAWIGWLRRRDARRLRDASTIRELVATAGRIVIDGAPQAAWHAVYEDGALRIYAPFFVSRVAARVRIEEAASIVKALGVADDGVRTIRVRGPVLGVPLLGISLAFAAPLVGLLAVLVLTSSSGLQPRGAIAFGIVLVVCTALTVVTFSARHVVVGEMGVDVRWLGRTTTHSFAEIERLALEDGVVVVRLRGGAPPRRFPLALPLWSTSTTLADARKRAEARAVGPIALATSRAVARVFD